jgi:hypothetical protein
MIEVGADEAAGVKRLESQPGAFDPIGTMVFSHA